MSWIKRAAVAVSRSLGIVVILLVGFSAGVVLGAYLASPTVIQLNFKPKVGLDI